MSLRDRLGLDILIALRPNEWRTGERVVTLVQRAWDTREERSWLGFGDVRIVKPMDVYTFLVVFLAEQLVEANTSEKPLPETYKEYGTVEWRITQKGVAQRVDVTIPKFRSNGSSTPPRAA